jgi:DNA-binding NtrC family response regulator
MISGIGDREHAEGLIRLGAFDFLLKPFTLEVVEKSVARALEYRRRMREGSLTEGHVSTSEGTGDDLGEWKIIKE